MTAPSSQPVGEEWSEKLPEEPSDYLFYGRFGSPGRFQTTWERFEICHSGRASNNVMMHSCGGVFLQKGEFTGKFKKLTEASPDIPKHEGP